MDCDDHLSAFRLTESHSRKHSSLVTDIARTAKYSLSTKVKNGNVLTTLLEILSDKNVTAISSFDRCLQFALCTDSQLNSYMGIIVADV